VGQGRHLTGPLRLGGLKSVTVWSPWRAIHRS
jgi:hypothetical protein